MFFYVLNKKRLNVWVIAIFRYFKLVAIVFFFYPMENAANIEVNRQAQNVSMTTLLVFYSCKQTPINILDTLFKVVFCWNAIYFNCICLKILGTMESADELELSDYSETNEEGNWFAFWFKYNLFCLITLNKIYNDAIYFDKCPNSRCSVQTKRWNQSQHTHQRSWMNWWMC